MNEQQLASTAVGFAIAAVLFLIVIYFWRKRNMTAHLVPVKRELKKEKQWLRRGEYNAAMVKGRQNLELFLKLVAEFNGIELDNSAQAMANAKSGPDGRGQRETYRMNGRKRQRVMTFQQFGWWLDENGYLDRVGKWELNEIRVIGNKAVHENYVSKEDAYNQYNYMEDLLKIVSDRHANRHRQRGPEIKKSQAGRRGASLKKAAGSQAKGHGQNQSQGRSQGRTGQSQSKNNRQSQAGRSQAKNSSQGMPQKREGGKQSGGKNGQNARPSGNARQDAKVSGKSGQQKSNGDQKTVQKTEIKKAAAKIPAASLVEKNTESVQTEKLSSSAKRRQRRKRAKAAREAAEAAGLKRENTPQVKTVKQAETRPVRAEEKTAKQTETRQVRQPRQVQPQTSMRIVTLSQSTGGRTAAVTGKKQSGSTVSQSKKQSGDAAGQPQGKDTAKQAARRRRPRRRPAAKNAERTVERTAAGGGDHEE